MKKKLFTLIEMLLVILIIAVLMLMMLRMGWRYVWNMQFRNDKEDFVGFFNKGVSQSMSSNYYNGNRFTQLGLFIPDNSKEIYLDALSGDQKEFLGKMNLTVSKIEGMTGDAKFVMDSYKIGCKYHDDNGEISTGDINFKLISLYGYYNFCFRVNLSNCKIFDIKCEEKNE